MITEIVQRLQAGVTDLRSRWQEHLTPPPGAGLYHYTRQEDGEGSRIHLRVDSDGSGLLIVNASRILHLNPTAVVMTYLVLQQVPAEASVRSLVQTYHVTPKQAHLDYTQTAGKLQELLRPDGACPIHELDLETIAPFSARPSAPYRMDLALTYRCNNDCYHCYNARLRSFPELQAADWFKILDQLWAIGIPHIVFTGGEPTLYRELPALIAHAEQNGQITGINTNGRRLSNPAYLHSLVEAGLDHVQITLESHDPLVHDRIVQCKGAWNQTVRGLDNVLHNSHLYVMTNTTLLQDNSPFLPETLDFLAEKGVPTVGLNALIYSGRGETTSQGLPEEALSPLLEIARQKTGASGQRLIWYTPTQYCHFDPVQFELGVKGCTAALYNMCVEPNGDVIPCQSYYQSVGNMLQDPWKAIWNHDLSVNLRERRHLPVKCLACAFVAECGGGCPLHPNNRP